MPLNFNNKLLLINLFYCRNVHSRFRLHLATQTGKTSCKPQHALRFATRGSAPAGGLENSPVLQPESLIFLTGKDCFFAEYGTKRQVNAWSWFIGSEEDAEYVF
jgi:hypothetical protein